MTTRQKWLNRSSEIRSILTVGLDSDTSQLPLQFQNDEHPQFSFNRWIIDQTAEVTAAYKLNLAFYEARGEAGIHDLVLTMRYLQEKYPSIVTIADAKRGDIGSTNQGYVTFIYDELRADAVTLHPYLGQEALAPFLSVPDKLSFILCHTSNPGAKEFQDMMVDHKPLWHHVAMHVADTWSKQGDCGLVVGATYPDELSSVRHLVGDSVPILVPGIGSQGGNVAETVKAGCATPSAILLLSVSRSIIFSENPKLAAGQLHTEIENERLKVV